MAEKVKVPFDAELQRTLSAIANPGVLLVAQGKDGPPNPMTIGWGTVGPVWSQPVFVALVRPSRYTHALLEQNDDFTVNVMPPEMADVVTYCGTVSGRDCDKLADKGLTAQPGLESQTPIIAESVMAYECRTVMKTEVIPDRLNASIRDSAYASGDFHTVYFGRILCVQADKSTLS